MGLLGESAGIGGKVIFGLTHAIIIPVRAIEGGGPGAKKIDASG